MPGFTSVQIGPNTDGLPYVQNALMPAVEGDLWGFASNPNNPNPIPVQFGAACLADVLFTVQGSPQTVTAYVVMQTDLGDGNWLDVAWCQTSITSGSALFGISGGVAGADSFQQRTVGTTPTGNGSNQIPLGGRIRFVGKSSINAGQSSSSASSGQANGVLVAVKFKILGLR